MASDTGIPAFFWSLFWGLSSIAMLFLTVKAAYWRRD
jgi:hypothetical protein